MKHTRKHLLLLALPLIALVLFSCDNLRNGDTNTATSDMPMTDSVALEENVETEIQEADTPTFVLDEMGVFSDDDPIIYFVASVNKAKYGEWKYIYADGPDSVAFIKADGKRQLLKTLESDVFEDGDDYRVTSLSQNEDYEVRVLQQLISQDGSGASWTGHITVTRRADGAVFKSDIYATSGH